LIGDDATLGTAETITRGTFAANGGIARDDIYHAGNAGQTLWVVGPSGVIDVRVTAAVRREGDGTTVKPSWRAADKGQ